MNNLMQSLMARTGPLHVNVEDVISCVVQEAAVRVRGFQKRPPALAGGVVTDTNSLPSDLPDTCVDAIGDQQFSVWKALQNKGLFLECTCHSGSWRNVIRVPPKPLITPLISCPQCALRIRPD